MAFNKAATSEPYGFTFKVQGQKLLIEVDLAQVGKLSSTHKAHTLATSGGNINIADSGPLAKVRLGLNCFTPIERDKWDATAKQAHLDAIGQRYVREMARLGVTVSPATVKGAEVASQAEMDAGEET